MKGVNTCTCICENQEQVWSKYHRHVLCSGYIVLDCFVSNFLLVDPLFIQISLTAFY